MNISLSKVAFLWASTFSFTIDLFPLSMLVVVVVEALLGVMDWGFGYRVFILGMGCRDVEGKGREKG